MNPFKLIHRLILGPKGKALPPGTYTIDVSKHVIQQQDNGNIVVEIHGDVRNTESATGKYVRPVRPFASGRK